MSKLFKLILLIITGALLVYYLVLRPKPKEETFVTTMEEPARTEFLQEKDRKDVKSGLPKQRAINETLNTIFNEFGLVPSWVQKNGRVLKIRIPQRVAAIVLVQRIINDMEDLGCNIRSSSENLSANEFRLDLGYKDKLVYQMIFIKDPSIAMHSAQGKIAIIIDDIGYQDGDEVMRILQSPFPFTFSILPGSPNSNKLYRVARNNGKETLIHLPMEALQEEVDETDYTIYANMVDEEVRKRVKLALADFPESEGVNNHMGSKITRDRHIMEIILEEIKKDKRFFVDSRTSTSSVAYKIARELQVRSVENNIFIDQNKNDSEEHLRNKLLAMANIAKSKGKVVAIAHPHKNSIKVLLEEIPKLQERGFTFVPVSKLVK